MNEIYQANKGVLPVSPLQTGRQFPIYTKDFTSVDQAVPIPVPIGRPKRFAGIQVTPIWGFRAEAITQEIGK